MKNNIFVCLLLGILVIAPANGTWAQTMPVGQAQADVDDGKVLHFDMGVTNMTLKHGKGQLISLPTDCKTIHIGDPEICDVVMMTRQDFLLVGKKTGQTNIYVWLDNDVKLESNIRVYDDTTDLIELIQRIMPYEHDVHVSIAHNTLILSGYVEKATSIENSQRIAEAYMAGKDFTTSLPVKVVNLLKVREEKQILLEVRLAEISRSAAEKMGIDWRYAGGLFGSYADFSWLDGGTPVSDGGASSLISYPSTNGAQGTSTGHYSWDKDSKMFGYGLDYVINKGLGRIIAKPNLLVRNGEEASFLAGGEFPVPIENQEAIQIEWKEYGIRLTFTPTLDERDNINLVLAPEVSVLDYSAASITLSSTQIPALKTRRTETKVVLRDGQSYYISGLISQTETEAFAKMPGISNVPILGELFKKKDNNIAETDLIVFVTPRIVKPFAKDVEKHFDDTEQMHRIANTVEVPFEQAHGDAIKDFIEQGEKPDKSLEVLKQEAIEAEIEKLMQERLQEKAAGPAVRKATAEEKEKQRAALADARRKAAEIQKKESAEEQLKEARRSQEKEAALIAQRDRLKKEQELKRAEREQKRAQRRLEKKQKKQEARAAKELKKQQKEQQKAAVKKEKKPWWHFFVPEKKQTLTREQEV